MFIFYIIFIVFVYALFIILHARNIFDISATFDVSQLFNPVTVSNGAHPLNKFAISVTFDVSKMDKSNVCKYIQVENMPFSDLMFDVSHRIISLSIVCIPLIAKAPCKVSILL